MQTEIRKIAPSLPPAARVRPLAAVRRFVGRWGQIAALAALPACYGVHDLVYGYQAGSVAGHPLIRHDLSMLGFNFAFAVGLSNGTIWALIAIGYTLVYGIIDLINFAALCLPKMSSVQVKRHGYHSLRAWFRRMADFGLWMSPQNPHKSASAAGGPHKNPTYETALPGTRRHGC
jgi:hypothetical protein